MKSLRCAAVILSACAYAFGTPGQEQPAPPPALPAPAATPAPPAPPAAPAPPAPDRQRVQAELDRAKAETQRAKAEMQRGLADVKAQAARGVYVKMLGRTEPAAYMGVSTSPVNAALAEQLKLPKGVGLVVDYVEPKSPAAEAQVKPYDVLHKLDDQLLINAHQFAVLVRTHKAGDEVTLSVIRQGEERPVKVKLVEREVSALDANNPWGMPGFFGEGGGGGGFGGGFSGGGAFRPMKVIPPTAPAPAKGRGPAATQPGARTEPGVETIPSVNQLFTATAGGSSDVRLTDAQGNQIRANEIRLTDAQGSLILQGDGVGLRLIVATPEGKWISTYQINEPGQLKILPPDVADRYERLLKVYRRVSEPGDAGGTPEKLPAPAPTPTPGTN